VIKVKGSIKSWAEEDRPREKLLTKGRHELTTAELLAVLIGSGYKSDNALVIARRVLQVVEQDLAGLARMSLEDLDVIPGLGEAKICRIIAALELGRRRQTQRTEEKPQVKCSADLDRLIRDVLTDLNREQFWVIYLNRANRYIYREQISTGGVSGTVVDIKLIFKIAVSRLASGIALCHNHPSGSLYPSSADKALTRKVVLAGQVLDVSVLDHIIVTDKGYYSFADNGMMKV
jgi:DNA repair protein RadC